jgi:hypothetical protein
LRIWELLMVMNVSETDKGGGRGEHKLTGVAQNLLSNPSEGVYADIILIYSNDYSCI